MRCKRKKMNAKPNKIDDDLQKITCEMENKGNEMRKILCEIENKYIEMQKIFDEIETIQKEKKNIPTVASN